MMLANTIFIEQLGEVPLYIGMGIQVLSAIVLGGLVGFDREKKMKSAGIKTNIMICLGATLYTIISLLNVKGHTVGVDPNRVGAQIVSGIGFLGAGAIIQGRGAVIGMTTAATIWVVAAIGYTIGIGYPICAAIFSLTVLVVLKWINPFYRLFESEQGVEYFHIELVSLGSVKKSVLELLKSEKIEIDEVYEDLFDKQKKKLTLYLYAHPRDIERVVNDFRAIASVNDTSCHRVDQAYLDAAEFEEVRELQELRDELEKLKKSKEQA